MRWHWASANPPAPGAWQTDTKNYTASKMSIFKL